MADRDIDEVADAYLVDFEDFPPADVGRSTFDLTVDPDDRPLDDARYDPLAADTADPCPRCQGQRYVNTPAGYISGVPAYRQEPCPDCNPGGPR